MRLAILASFSDTTTLCRPTLLVQSFEGLAQEQAHKRTKLRRLQRPLTFSVTSSLLNLEDMLSPTLGRLNDSLTLNDIERH